MFRRIIYLKNKIFSRLVVTICNLNPNIRIHKTVFIEPGVIIRSQYGGKITIGAHCYLSNGAQLLTHGGNIVIGDNSTINPYTVIYGQGGTRIGSGVRIAAHCCIVSSNHIFLDPSQFIYKQGLSKKGIIIEDDVWLGSGVKVLDGVVISKGCVIGANAVVSKSTESYSVYVGIPAKKIKERK